MFCDLVAKHSDQIPIHVTSWVEFYPYEIFRFNFDNKFDQYFNFFLLRYVKLPWMIICNIFNLFEIFSSPTHHQIYCWSTISFETNIQISLVEINIFSKSFINLLQKFNFFSLLKTHVMARWLMTSYLYTSNDESNDDDVEHDEEQYTFALNENFIFEQFKLNRYTKLINIILPWIETGWFVIANFVLYFRSHQHEDDGCIPRSTLY